MNIPYIVSQIIIPVPTEGATTITGQFQFLAYGSGYGLMLSMVALCIRYARRAGGSLDV